MTGDPTIAVFAVITLAVAGLVTTSGIAAYDSYQLVMRMRQAQGLNTPNSQTKK